MYTKLTVDLRLDENNKHYEKVKNVLNMMLVDEERDIDKEIKFFGHPFFETRRWEGMFSSSSSYFDDHDDGFLLNNRLYVDFDMKNYDNEIQKFLDWIHPYTTSRGKVGVYRYEEYMVDSDVIFNDGGFVINSREEEVPRTLFYGY